MEQLKVLFIGGADRSGSTILERALANVPGLVAVGELRYLWDRALILNELCGCGTPARQCPFWLEVIKEAFGGIHLVDAEAILALRTKLDRTRSAIRLSRPAGSFSHDLARYGEALSKVYRAIERITGGSVIVDSSKTPAHGMILAQRDDLLLYVLHLIRDSRGVAYSWQRRKQRPEGTGARAYMPTYGPITTSAWWIARNLLMRSVVRRARSALQLRYEDFTADHEHVLGEVVRFVGLGDEARRREADESTWRVHTVSGNPIRMKRGPLVVKADVEWQRKMSRRHRALVTTLTLPMLLAYRYIPSMRPSSPAGSEPASDTSDPYVKRASSQPNPTA